MERKYVFKPYDPIFAELFKNERERILTFFGNEELLVEHVGSTSVPGLGGKGIIDIAVAAPKDQIPRVSVKLAGLGYQFKEAGGTADRWFHSQELPDPIDQVRTYHLHLVSPDGVDWRDMIAFRNYLREHPEDLKRYAEIKRKAAELSNEDREIYVTTKEPIILEIIQKATSSK